MSFDANLLRSDSRDFHCAIGEDIMISDTKIIRSRATTPRAAAFAGILFSILMIISLVLVRISVPSNPQAAGDWLSSYSGTVTFALNLLPFAGIAFLWFIGVVRDQLGNMKFASLPPCSWVVGSCFWPCCSHPRQLQEV